MADHLVKRSYSEPHWSTKRAAAMVHEKVTLYGLPIVDDRVVGYRRVDPDHARELFIRHALVEGDWNSPHAFIAENRACLDELEELEHRFRRSDLVVDLDTLERLYDERVPADVVSGRDFDAWWRDARGAQPDLFTFTADDLLHDGADELDEDDFPAVWHQGELTFGLSYAFDPGTTDDGVAVHIPVGVLNQVRPEGFDWQVPGLRVELVSTLIRSLPKALRRGLVPVPETVAAFLRTADPTREPLLDALERELGRRGGSRIRRQDWDVEGLPPHLRILFLVIDDDDQVLAQGEDLDELTRRLAGPVRQAIAEAGGGIERSGLTDWDGDELPHLVEREVAGQRIRGYPALVDDGDTVSVQVMDTADAQHQAMWAGTRRLLQRGLGRAGQAALRGLTNDDRLILGTSPYPRVADLVDDCVVATLDDSMARAGAPVWTRQAFDELRRHVTTGFDARLGDTVAAVVGVLRASGRGGSPPGRQPGPWRGRRHRRRGGAARCPGLRRVRGRRRCRPPGRRGSLPPGHEPAPRPARARPGPRRPAVGHRPSRAAPVRPAGRSVGSGRVGPARCPRHRLDDRGAPCEPVRPDAGNSGSGLGEAGAPGHRRSRALTARVQLATTVGAAVSSSTGSWSRAWR